jgi:hypothetical protein
MEAAGPAAPEIETSPADIKIKGRRYHVRWFAAPLGLSHSGLRSDFALGDEPWLSGIVCRENCYNCAVSFERTCDFLSDG